MTAIAESKPYRFNEIQLIEEISKLITIHNKVIYGSDNYAKHILFEAAYPDYVFDKTGQTTVIQNASRLICYDIQKKENGSIDSKMFANKVRFRPIIAETRSVVINEGQPDEQDVMEEIYMKRYDVTYRFDCLAPTDKECMELIREFERMLEVNSKYLELGCPRFIYAGRRPSYFNRDTNYKSRTCLFDAQVEEQWYSIKDKIKEIEIEYTSLTA